MQCKQLVTWLKDWFYDKTEINSILNNKANLNHTHLKGDINFQNTSSSFNIHLYADNHMVDRNNFEIPANDQMTLNFSDLLNNSYQDYVSFKITGTGGELSSVYISDSQGDVLYNLDSSYDITIKKITNGYDVMVYDSEDIPTSYNVNAPFIYIDNSSNDIITGYFSSKTYYRKATWLDMIYPIGSIYISTQNRNPSLYFGGVWEQIEDRFLLSSGQDYNVQEVGGEATHTLTKDEMPSHTHIQNSHNHTQNGHSHIPASGRGFLTAPTGSTWAELQGANVSGSGYHYIATSNKSKYDVSCNASGTTTATNQAQTATNQNTGGGLAHNNMPPYFVVSVWERLS